MSEDVTKYDDKLDPLSENFDPIASLYSDSDVELPAPNAPVLDNLSRFEQSTEGVEVKSVKPKKVVTAVPLVLPARDLPGASSSQTPQVIIEKKSVLKFMENVSGPLSRLRDCMERRAKIKVTTRSAVSIRGEVVGYLAAFDKMWNLAMEEVTEVWTRKRKKKTPCLIQKDELKWITVGHQRNPWDEVGLSCSNSSQYNGLDEISIKNSYPKARTVHDLGKTSGSPSWRVYPPAVLVTQIDRKTERCERHVPKLLMRGEHVVHVRILE